MERVKIDVFQADLEKNKEESIDQVVHRATKKMLTCIVAWRRNFEIYDTASYGSRCRKEGRLVCNGCKLTCA